MCENRNRTGKLCENCNECKSIFLFSYMKLVLGKSVNIINGYWIKNGSIDFYLCCFDILPEELIKIIYSHVISIEHNFSIKLSAKTICNYIWKSYYDEYNKERSNELYLSNF